MQRPAAAAGSALFFIVAPGVVAGLVPWWLTRWEMREPLPYWAPVRIAGTALLGVGLAALLHAFARFVVAGGTPAPLAPTQQLVVAGLYRHVRNPMYLAVVATIVGQGFLLGQLRLLAYAAGMLAAFAAFVHWYEEPALERRFGAEYEEYRHAVRGWWPQLRPWESPRAS